MPTQLQLVIIGGVIGIAGALLGAGAGAIIEFWLQGKRDKRKERKDNAVAVREWAETGKTKNMRGCDLFGANLRGVDFSYGLDQEKRADLSYSDLRKADLSYAKLARTNLRGANMRGALLTQTDLTQALLIETNLCETNLGEAIIDHANLYKSNMRKAKVTIEQLSKTDTFDKSILFDGTIHREDEEDEEDA